MLVSLEHNHAAFQLVSIAPHCVMCPTGTLPTPSAPLCSGRWAGGRAFRARCGWPAALLRQALLTFALPCQQRVQAVCSARRATNMLCSCTTGPDSPFVVSVAVFTCQVSRRGNVVFTSFANSSHAAGVCCAQRHALRLHHRPHPLLRPGLPHRGRRHPAAVNAQHPRNVRHRRCRPRRTPLHLLLQVSGHSTSAG